MLQAAWVDKRGAFHPKLKYVADFAYTEDGISVVEDVKGVRTAVFKLKAEWFQRLYPDIDFRIVEVR